MKVIRIIKLNNTEKLINETEKEYNKTKSILCKQFLDGRLSILKELQKNGIECHKNMLSNNNI